MSVSMWSYRPEVCDGEGCPGDCDLCNKPQNMEDEQLDTCPLYGGVCGYPSDRCYECPRHAANTLTADVVEAEKVNKIYEKLADLFDTPCNYSPCDEIMLESERCREDCGNISDAECWRRYFEVIYDGERAEE